MNPFLIIQSTSGRYNDPYNRWMACSRKPHAEYARRCGADYRYWCGVKDADLPPSWTRVPLMREALAEGYEQVLWLDADTLVVRPDENIFVVADRTGNACRGHRDEQNTTQPHLQMTRQHHSHTEWPWRTDPTDFDLYNCGVIVARNTPETLACLDYVWAHRHDTPAWYHVDRMWEMNQFNDYFYDHPEVVVDLTEHWNSWHPFHSAMVDAPAIRAWHGRALGSTVDGTQSSFSEFLVYVREVYG